MSNTETILVVGGAGYIGSVASALLAEHGHRVIVFDNLEKGHRQAVHESAGLVVADLRDKDAVKAVFDDNAIDAVMHFGAYSLVGESMTQPDKYFHNNTEGGRVLIDQMRDHDVKRIVFSSTAAVYGNPEDEPIQEDSRTIPINPYGRSKLAFEYILKSYEEAYGIHYAVLRYFNAAGATQTIGEDHDPETHIIPLTLQVALGQREHISIFGADYDTPDGTCVRDYIHVSDLAEAHRLALEFIRNESITCNLGNGQGFSVREVIEACRVVSEHPIPAIEAPRRPGDPDRLTASAQRAKERLGWTPQITDLRDIVASAWNWHKKNPNGYDS
ncbi:MAG: UDP-glucose 4-epimerase GalE [Candidatus Hinthialibacter antarcticus]|nr:UDP-glucose 4-epimerase GalE [Candidatus Hinthialibacter antarcticus]